MPKAVEVVAALIWRGGRFLACQRPAHKARGLLWEFVGGKVEPGETKEEALVRECREELGVTFYLAMGVDACLAIYPQSTWDRFTEKFSSLPMSQSKAMRPLFANAAKCELDSQGRIVIPQKLRRYAGLDKDVVILGVNDRAEIWSADAWQAQEEEEMTPEKMSACMEALGF